MMLVNLIRLNYLYYFVMTTSCKNLNKEWKGVDAPTDVLSMSQHIPELDLPIKLLFLDTAEGDSSVLQPHWAEATEGRVGASKHNLICLKLSQLVHQRAMVLRLLRDHLGISAEEVMAIGDGENNVEMLELASLGIALRNGSEKAKAGADVIGAINDEDGVAETICQYAF